MEQCHEIFFVTLHVHFKSVFFFFTGCKRCTANKKLQDTVLSVPDKTSTLSVLVASSSEKKVPLYEHRAQNTGICTSTSPNCDQQCLEESKSLSVYACMCIYV